MIDTWQQVLPGGISLSCRAAGKRGRPVLMFLHGFPEAAFVWDELLQHFAQPEHGGFRCLAPNMRGYEYSSAPSDVSAYRSRHLVQDLVDLAAIESPSTPLAGLIAHDWGGALAWNLANQRPERLQKLVILNAPHPGTFLRELKRNPRQQAASAYMNFLVRADAEPLLAENDYARLWDFFLDMGAGAKNHGWLDDSMKARYRDVWSMGLTGGLNYYRATPLRPPDTQGPSLAALDLPRSALMVDVPTLVIWGLGDTALLPELLDDLESYVPRLTVQRLDWATHWLIHEEPAAIIAFLEHFLAQ